MLGTGSTNFGVLPLPIDLGTLGATGCQLVTNPLAHNGITTIAGLVTGAPGYARFSFALGDADLEEGVRRIADLFA